MEDEQNDLRVLSGTERPIYLDEDGGAWEAAYEWDFPMGMICGFFLAAVVIALLHIAGILW